MGETTLQEALNEFKTTYMPARNLAARTREEYANDLAAFLIYLRGLGIAKTGEVAINHVDQYLAYLDEKGFSGSTRKRKAIVFRSFLSFLYRNNSISNDISHRIIVPFADHPLPRILTQSEYKHLLEVSSFNIRDYSIISLLLQTGMKLSELVRLPSTNIHIPDSIDITSMNSKKRRSIPLNSKACEALQAYLAVRPASGYTNVFLNSDRKPLGERGVQKLVMKYYKQAGISSATVQTLRHTFAVQHIAKGTTLKTVQNIMGHKDIRTTEEYLPLVHDLTRREMEENAL